MMGLRTVRWIGLRGLAMLASAVLLVLSLPPWGWSVLGWVALVPALLALRGESRPLVAAAWGWLFGLALWLLVFAWLFLLSGFMWYHGLLLAAVLAGTYALWALLLAYAPRGPLWAFWVASAWVLTMYARHHWGFLALPWASLAQSQTQAWTLAPLAWVGEYGLDGLMVLAAASGVEILCCWRQAAPWRVWGPSLLILALGLAASQLPQPWLRSESTKLRVAVVQPDFRHGQFRSAAKQAEAMQRLTRLSSAAHAAGAQVLVWPESATFNLESNMLWIGYVIDLSQRLGVPILAGSTDAEKIDTQRVGRQFNSVYAVQPGQLPLDPYHKIRLMPFAETMPKILGWTWPDWLVPKMFDVTPGQHFQVMTVAGGRAHPLICWENLFSDLVRDMVQQGGSGGVHWLSHHVNDNWFGPTAAPYQHNNISRMRAVEVGRAVVVASNTGPSQIINASGQVLAQTPAMFQPAWASAEIAYTQGQTAYTRWGDGPSLLAALGVLLLGVAMKIMNRIRRGGDTSTTFLHQTI